MNKPHKDQCPCYGCAQQRIIALHIKPVKVDHRTALERELEATLWAVNRILDAKE